MQLLSVEKAVAYHTVVGTIDWKKWWLFVWTLRPQA